MDKAKKLAEDHWGYVGALSERMYKEAFVHGYKHGREDASEGCGCEVMDKAGERVREEVNNQDGVFSEQQECAAAWNEYDDRYTEEGP